MRIQGCVLALAVAWPITTSAGPIDVVNPNKADWEFKPSGDAMSAAFPPLAMALGLEGATTMQCVVDRLGVLHECKVVEFVGPKGLGFEAASLSLAPMFRIRPDRSPSGRGRNGAARFPLSFRLPVLNNELPVVSPAPAPDLMPLARELVGRFATNNQLDQTFAQANATLAASPTPDVDPLMKSEIVEDVRQAQAKVHAEVLEFQAGTLASSLTRRQIQAALDFDKTSSVQTLRKVSGAMRREAEKSIFERRFWLLYAAHSEFCRAHDCNGSVEGDAPPPVPWIQQPIEAQIEAASPKLAMFLLIGGYADLDCAATDFGVLANCQVVREKPVDLGFGAAALAVAGYYRRPPGLRGERTPLRVAFPFPDIPKLEPPAKPRKQGPKITLAREVVEAEGRAVTLGRQATWQIEAADHVDLPGVPDATRTEAMVLLRKQLQIFTDDLIAEETEKYAEVLTEAELRERLAYFKSPDYAALTAVDEKTSKAYQQLSEVIYTRVSDEAQRLWCAKHDCPKPPPYRGPRTAADPIPPLRP